MQYDVTHTTEYDYSQSVVVAHHAARLKPRELPQQECLSHELAIAPAPAVTSTYEDYFGNLVTNVAVQGAHKSLVIRARSTVNVTVRSCHGQAIRRRGRRPPTALPCHSRRSSSSSIRQPHERSSSWSPTRARRFRLDGRCSRPSSTLTARIHEEFTFDPKATTIATPLTEVFASRRGVCQDFARLEIACLRSLGIPARYISGYMETVPPPGKPRLVGADASHAWLAVHCPGIGWIPVDPTNNLLPTDRHITLAWGRDYNDVSPIHGVILGGGAHDLRVRVDVVRLE